MATVEKGEVPEQVKEKQEPINTHGKKLRKVVKPPKSNDKTLWLVGHLTTIVCGTLYAMYYMQRKSQGKLIPFIAYKLALCGIWLSYSIAIKSQFNVKSLPHYSTLIATENFQYLLLSILWFFNRNSLFKILPYMIISLLHLATKFNLDAVLKFEKQLNVFLLYNELFLIFLLFIDTLLLRGTSGYGLVVYCMFMWLRILQNENTRFFLYANLKKLDTLMLKIKNPKVQQGWLSIKKFLSYKQANFEQKFLY